MEVVGLLTDSLSLSLDDLRLFHEKTTDVALSIRKQAVASLTNMMRVQPTHPILYPIWLRAVLSSVLDPETSMQEKCLDYFEEIVLQRVIAYSK